MHLTEAAAKALSALTIPGIWGVIILTFIVTLLSLCGFVIGFSWLAFHVSATIHSDALATLVRWGGSIGAGVLAWLLFPGIMPLIVSFFDDKIAYIIDRRDYPGVSLGAPVGFWPEILHDLGFSLKAICLNLICLPLYLVPGLNLFLFYILNGYLLGREFFIMAARRYLPRAQAEQLRSVYAFKIFAGGVLLAFLATIPFVNLIAPFWGIALATHLFHQVYDPGDLRRLTTHNIIN